MRYLFFMTQTELENLWNYYLTLESDIANTSRYIEPDGQENVYSYEFAKLIILSCTEVENSLKTLCMEKIGKECGNISEYKNVVLNFFPKIVEAEVYVSRWAKSIQPFFGWNVGKLSWWEAYNDLKHNRGRNFKNATYENAVYSLAALYLLILYLAKVINARISNARGTYIISDYTDKYIVCSPIKQLPDFEDGEKNQLPLENRSSSVKLFHQKEEPSNSLDGDFWIKTEK